LGRAVHGLELPNNVLQKLYHRNAQRRIKGLQ
jgi:hypothetical protein